MQKNQTQNEQAPELLKSAEFFSTMPAPEAQADVELTQARVEATVSKRSRMLASIKSAISLPLGEALAIKIQHEEKELLGMIDADSRALEAQKKRNKVLEYDFFKKKTLNLNSF